MSLVVYRPDGTIPWSITSMVPPGSAYSDVIEVDPGVWSINDTVSSFPLGGGVYDITTLVLPIIVRGSILPDLSYLD